MLTEGHARVCDIVGRALARKWRRPDLGDDASQGAVLALLHAHTRGKVHGRMVWIIAFRGATDALCAALWEKRKRTPPPTVPLHSCGDIPAPPNGVACVDAADEAAALLALASPRQAEALRLRYIEGLPLATVAERMGVTTGTVAHYVSDGLRSIKERAATLR